MISSIVVGVDGSPHADRALRYAIDEALAHGASLTVVFAHVHPTSLAFGDRPGPMAWAWFDERGLHAAAQRELDEALERAAPPDALDLRSSLVEAHPVEALLGAAEAVDADLLVVGSRGRGGFRGLLLGSTSQEVAAHASCPVVVVPASTGDASGDDDVVDGEGAAVVED